MNNTWFLLSELLVSQEADLKRSWEKKLKVTKILLDLFRL